MSKYEWYYDDSSSEEEEKQVCRNYSTNTLDFGMKKTKENLKDKCKRFYRMSNNDFNNDLELSFIIHEAAVNLIKSPKIGESFFPLKSRWLRKNKVLSEGDLKEICKESITETLDLQGIQEVKQQKIENFTNNLVFNKRALVKAIESGDLSYFYPFTNPLGLETEKCYTSSAKLKTTITNLCQKPKLNDNNQLTRKSGEIYRVTNYDSVYLSVPQTNLEKFLKDKLLNLKTAISLKDFITQIQKDKELSNALDSKQDEFRKTLYSKIQIKSNLAASSANVIRATLPKHFDYKIGEDNFITNPSHELIILGRLMTTSLKRACKNAEGKDSLLGSTESAFFRKVILGQIPIVEKQSLYKTGARSDYVDIEVRGKGSDYQNIAATIEHV